MKGLLSLNVCTLKVKMEENEMIFSFDVFISTKSKTLYKQQNIYGDGAIADNMVYKWLTSFSFNCKTENISAVIDDDQMKNLIKIIQVT